MAMHSPVQFVRHVFHSKLSAFNKVEIQMLMIAAVIVVLLFIVGGKLYKFYLFAREFNKIPAMNLPIPLLGAPYVFTRMPREDHLEWFRKQLSEHEYGYCSLWILSQAIVNIHKPEPIEALLRSSEQIEKPRLYDGLKPWLGQGLLTSSASEYVSRRKFINPFFNLSILEKFSEIMLEKAAIFNQCLEQQIKIHGDKPFEIFEMSLKCALDIICESAMGVDIRAQEQDDFGYVDSVKSLTWCAYLRIFTPWLASDWVYYKTPQGKVYTAALESANDFCAKVIHRKLQERRTALEAIEAPSDFVIADKPKRQSFLDLLLDASEKEENPLTFEEIRDHIQTIMFAGHDTTGALIGWTCFCLGNELDVQRKVHEELDEVLGDGDDQAILKQLPQLKYLERVIKEVLRLYPSATGHGRKITKDFQIGDHTIPAGATALIHIYNVHRDPNVWPDPERFDPDRFLPENSKGRHRYAWVPFSGGVRSCVGQKYAMIEAKIVLAKALREFSVRSVENYSTLKMFSAFILRPTHGVFVTMSKRSRTVQ